MPKRWRKRRFRKQVTDRAVCSDSLWRVWQGRLVPSPGALPGTQSLFSVVAEKLPYESLRPVQNALKKLKEKGVKTTGVYIAHDSMGTPRYIGRGAIFPRLRARKNQNRLELKYYSFYVVPNPSHEREVETLMIRAAGPLLEFNERKKRVTLDTGSIHDYMAGTFFFQRRRARVVKRRRRSRGKAV